MSERVDCPACEGDGEWDTMTNLFWNGDSTWKTERCERCEGRGWVELSDLTDEEIAEIKRSQEM